VSEHINIAGFEYINNLGILELYDDENRKTNKLTKFTENYNSKIPRSEHAAHGNGSKGEKVIITDLNLKPLFSLK